MFLGYDFKDPVGWAKERTSSKRGYWQEILVSILVGFIAISVVVAAQLTRGISVGSLMIVLGVSFLILDAVVLRGIMYVMALRRLALGRQATSVETSNESHPANEDEL